MGGDGDARFLAQLNVLASSWLLWIIVPDIRLWREIAGHAVGIEPTTWIFTPLVVLELARLRAVVPAAVRRAFTTVLALGTLAGALDLARSLVGAGYGPGSALGSAVQTLVMLGLGMFCLAMARWCVVPPTGATAPAGAPAVKDWLARAWRRSACWAGAGLVAGVGVTLGSAVHLVAGGRSLTADWTFEVDGYVWLWAPLGMGLVVLMFGPLFSAAGSTNSTRWAIEALAVADTRPHVRRVAGA